MGHFFKYLGEVGIIFIAQNFGNFGQGIIGVNHESFGFQHNTFHNKLGGGLVQGGS